MRLRNKVIVLGDPEAEMAVEPKIETMYLPDDGVFPNNANLPLVLMSQAFDPGHADLLRVIEEAFHSNGWGNSWRNGLFSFHHYHSRAHEVLGLYSGWVQAQFGGPEGKIVTARAGDVVVVPAGVAHKNLGQSADFRCVGAYPHGQAPDMKYGKPGERPQADGNIKRVPRPNSDPVFGESGPLMGLFQ